MQLPAGARPASSGARPAPAVHNPPARGPHQRCTTRQRAARTSDAHPPMMSEPTFLNLF